jgi:hypothetical protein
MAFYFGLRNLGIAIYLAWDRYPFVETTLLILKLPNHRSCTSTRQLEMSRTRRNDRTVHEETETLMPREDRSSDRTCGIAEISVQLLRHFRSSRQGTKAWKGRSRAHPGRVTIPGRGQRKSRLSLRGLVANRERRNSLLGRVQGTVRITYHNGSH